MNCPDIERLLDLSLGASVDPESEAHLRECADCRTLMRFVVETEAAFTPAIVAPESLITATVEALVESADSTVGHASGVSLWDAVPTGVLAATTVLVTGVATGSFGTSLAGLGACVLSGVAAVIYEIRGAPRLA